MSSVIPLSDSTDKAARQKAFRRQFADNLNAALDRRGAIPAGYGRVTAVAELFGVSQNTAANWLRGDGVPELGRLPEIAETLNTTVEELVMGGMGNNAHVIDERYAVVDLHGNDLDEAHAFYTLPETLRELSLPRGVRMMRVLSEDMEPYVRAGDVVVYDPRVNRIQANGVFVLQIGETLCLRRVQRSAKDRTIRLICDNERFGDEVLAEDDFGHPEDGHIGIVGFVLGRLLIGR